MVRETAPAVAPTIAGARAGPDCIYLKALDGPQLTERRPNRA